MKSNSTYTLLVSLVVALGGFLMGFDSAVISGVVDPVKDHFSLSPDGVGWAVSCLTLGATLAMAIAGPLADRFGRKPVLMVTALLFTVSALGSSLAETYWFLIVARIVGGFGVGGALLIAPIYIAEIAPPERRGRLVSFNQLNIVLGFSAAFFSNYFLNEAGLTWRWMLGMETVPAALYLLLLFFVPRSPRWLAMKGCDSEALSVLERAVGADQAHSSLLEIQTNLAKAAGQARARLMDIFNRRMSRIMLIGLGLGFFQQITGINAIFYYATTIFDMAGAARDVALLQAILVGIVNVVFTIIAMRLIDRAGRRPLLLFGTALMTLALLSNSWAFKQAEYRLTSETIAELTTEGNLSGPSLAALEGLSAETFADQKAFREALLASVDDSGAEEAEILAGKVPDLCKASLTNMNALWVLISIMLYIAAFAISLGPVMWAMFSEIFPMAVRGLAISVAGFFNSAISFLVQQLFPRGLASVGPEGVFLFFGVFAALAFLFTVFVIPETKGRTLEELEEMLVRAD